MDTKESLRHPEEWNGRLDKSGRAYFKEKYGVDIVEVSQEGGNTHGVTVRRSSDQRQLLQKEYPNYQKFVDSFEMDVAEHPLVKQYLLHQDKLKGGSISAPGKLDPSSQDTPRNQTHPSEHNTLLLKEWIPGRNELVGLYNFLRPY